MTFDVATQTTYFKSPLTPDPLCPWIKNLSAKAIKYTPKYSERFVKMRSNHNLCQSH